MKHIETMLGIITKEGKKFDFGGDRLKVGIEVLKRNDRFVVRCSVKEQDDKVILRGVPDFFRDNMMMVTTGGTTMKMDSSNCFEMSDVAIFVRGTDTKMDSVEDEMSFSKDELNKFSEYVVCILQLVHKANTLSACGDVYELVKMAFGIDLSKERFCVHCKKYENVDRFREASENICAEWIVQYRPCGSCGELLSPKQFKLFNIKGKSHCRKCILEPKDKGKANWVGYSDKPSAKFFGAKDDGYFFGVEVEYECPRSGGAYDKKDISDIVAKCGEHIYFKNDGSLSNGSELITHPCTIKYHEENTIPMLEILNQLDCHADNNTTCGLHAHIGKNMFDSHRQQGKLIWLMDYYWDTFVKLSRRKNGNLSWCRQPEKPSGVTERKFTREKLGTSRGGKDEVVDHSSRYYEKNREVTRYKAINLQPRNTVELRIADGTLTPRFFMGTLEMFSRMVDIAKSDINFMGVSFKDMFYNKGYEHLDRLIDELAK